jgi:hypothetical protein
MELPDTEVLTIDVDDEPMRIPEVRWQLVHRVLGFNATNGDFWDALVTAMPSTHADGSVVRSVLFPRPARDLHLLIPAADPKRLYMGRLRLVMTTNAWRPASIVVKDALSSGFVRVRSAAAMSATGPCHAHLYFDDLRALAPSVNNTESLPMYDWMEKTWNALVSNFNETF